jgi:FkbM family methyltransferase
LSFRTQFNKILSHRGMEIIQSTREVLHSNARLEVGFDFLIRSVITVRGGKFNFAQIGANDGVSRAEDLISYVQEYDTTGLVVEPQPDMFETLKNNFKDYKKVVVLDKAIHLEKKSMTLYRLNQEMLADLPDMPLWATTNGIASFDRSHVVKHLKKLRLKESYIQEISVDCIGVDELMKLCGNNLDLFQIDVEGYDFEIINALDLEQICPKIFRFENLHMTKSQYQSIINKFSTVGYKFMADRSDTIAYLLEW